MKIPFKIATVFSKLLGVSLLVITAACQGDTEEVFTNEVEYYKYGQLTNIYENAVLPLNNAFTAATASLIEQAIAFRQDTSPDNLSILQDRWEQTERVWKQLELYDLGAVGESFVAFQINRWPTDAVRIEQNIAGSETLDEAFIGSLGSSSKGLAALEYLLYPEDGNTSVLERYTEEADNYRRLDYLLALAENLNTLAMEYRTLWINNAESFANSLQNGIDGSQNQVINAMVSLTEEIIITKLGNPLGDSNGGTPDPLKLEAYRSNSSKMILQQHLTALQQCYNGDFSPTSFRVGFDDFLNLIGSTEVSDKIQAQFKDCQEHLNAITGSLEQELETNPETVMELKNSFRELLVLIKVDMANILGSTITFNDNDGD